MFNGPWRPGAYRSKIKPGLYRWARGRIASPSVSAARRERRDIRLDAASGLEALDESGIRWRAVTHQPRFAFGLLREFAGRWVELSIELTVDEPAAGNAVVHCDTGKGPFDDLAVELPQFSWETRKATVIFAVPPELTDAQFAPCGAPTEFRIESIRMEGLSRWQAMFRMARAMKGTGYLAGLRDSYAPRWLALGSSAGRRELKGAFVQAYRTMLRSSYSTYSQWIALFEVRPRNYPSLASRRERWGDLPLISIVMPISEASASNLYEAIDSVVHQQYPRWQLCIADDGSEAPHVRKILDEFATRDSRIHVVYPNVLGCAAAVINSSLDLATGAFVGLLDQGDRLHPLALHYVAEAIRREPEAAILFSDEDMIDSSGARFAPHFKTAFNYQLFLAQNVIRHFGCYRRELVTRLNGFRSGYGGFYEWDLALRIIETIGPGRIVHIPRVLYHARALPGGPVMANDEQPTDESAGCRVVREHLERQQVDATVGPLSESPAWNRVRYASAPNPEKVSIVIPTRDQAPLLRTCVDSILKYTRYVNFEIIIVDNGSVESATLEYLASLERSGIRVMRDASPFNYSRLNNWAVAQSSGFFICLMNDDVEVMNEDWLDEMVALAVRPRIGVVGARLWYPDFRLQHAGVILGIRGTAGHAHRLLPKGQKGYFGRAIIPQETSAVTGACFLVKRDIWNALDGLDESFAVAFNDIDFCMRANALGHQTVWTPFADLIHHESYSRGSDDTQEKIARFRDERMRMHLRWKEALIKDPYYSPNLTLLGEDFSMSWNPQLH